MEIKDAEQNRAIWVQMVHFQRVGADCSTSGQEFGLRRGAVQ